MITPSFTKLPVLITALAITHVPLPKLLNLLTVDFGCIRLTIFNSFSFNHFNFRLLNSLSPIATKKASYFLK